ncbi:hypothetical protein [Paenibacillus sp. UASWS1643]|uniref:hypothetical protein n=1 Tax=Paenibacillus sp. UASWS1643 TaxID=2580422 RepID=UPI00123C5385|nr:hypothetical protein [Paenibacillus sp. UASWS1643]KAA8758027.1 hypothetical protein FE296_00310 [Paenibacillus sp. UASWS1643]
MTEEQSWSLLLTLCYQRIHWLEARISICESLNQDVKCYKAELACYQDLKKFVDEKLGGR